MSGLSELIMDLTHLDSNSKHIINAQATIQDITDRVNNGENPDDAVKKSLISAFASAPLDAYYGQTMLETWAKLDPAVKTELENSIEDLWNSTKALNEEMTAENIENFLESLKNASSCPWKTIGERLLGAQEAEFERSIITILSA